MTKSACKEGSAWHTWQKTGEQFQGFSREYIEAEAQNFANAPGWPQAARSARYRAFMEGAITLATQEIQK